MNQTLDEKPTPIITSPRNRFQAFLLSLLFPGLGQVYNGQPKKAILLLGLLLFIPLLFGITRGSTFFYGITSLCFMVLALRIYIIIDGVKFAKRQQEYVLKPYNTWYYYLLIAVGISAIFIAYDSKTILGTQTFKIPTTSNNPTFQVGDWLVADMRAYKNTEPDYGDIVVFSRTDGNTYTFRVVGKPSDNLELLDNIPKINGELCKATFIKDTTIQRITLGKFEEELPNGHKHFIYKNKYPNERAKNNIKNIVVPSDSYYVLGDNRDDAFDSRYADFVRKDSIKGRIVYSYWGQEPFKRMNVDFRDK